MSENYDVAVVHVILNLHICGLIITQPIYSMSRPQMSHVSNTAGMFFIPSQKSSR